VCVDWNSPPASVMLALAALPVAGAADMLPAVGVRTIPPEPPLMVVVEVEFVEPKVAVLAAAPVATLTTVAAASAEMFIAPVPLTTVTAPFVPVMATPPEPD